MVVVRFLRVLRNNWKKSIFFSSLAAYGGNVLVTRIQIHQMMRAYCEEATRYGDQPLTAFRPARHVTVLLNPVAKDKKGKALYEKYVAPLFHCAGLKISLVQTESEGQARDLMEIMENTDAIVVAGGNGTLHEVVTGLLRRADEQTAVQKFPLGVVPIGKRNTVALNLNERARDILREKGKKLGEIQVLAEAAMAVIQEVTKPIDVMKIEAKNRQKAVFALEGIHFGSLKDIVNDVDKYWIFGNTLKAYYAMTRQTVFKNWTDLTIPCDIHMSYTDPCSGCSKCYQRHETNAVSNVNQSNGGQRSSRKWWSSFVPRSLGSSTAVRETHSTPKIDYKKVNNESCGVWREYEAESDGKFVDLLIHNSLREGKLNIMGHKPSQFTQKELVNEGVTLYRGSPLNRKDGLEVQDVRLTLKTNRGDDGDNDKRGGLTDETNLDAESSPAADTDPEANDLWFSIDSEKYEAENVDITLLPKKVIVYVK